MSRLQGKLNRRLQRKPATADDNEHAGADSGVQPESTTSVVETDIQEDQVDVGGSKSEIIAQLQRRMAKIESKRVKAFGTGNKSAAERTAAGSHWDTDATSMSAFGNETDSIAGDTNDDRQLPRFNPDTMAAVSSDDVVIQKEALLPGTVLDTAFGEIWLNRQCYPGYYHGRAAVNRYLSVGKALATFAKDKRLATLSPEGALFIDTETTGLSSGAGTLPFLIGCGFFEDGVLVVEQYFCREPSEEPAQLEALAARLAKATYLVSFNGKSFDMPLVNTRFIINKAKNPAYNLPHLDLLHVCRRIFKRRLNDRSLQNLERVILGFEREGDIPGAMIPDAYRDYLFGHGEAQIAAILEHNLLDIVALAALGGVLDEIYNDPDAVADVADHLGLAKEAFGAGEDDIGHMHLDAAEDGGAVDDRRIALHMKARTALRQKKYFEAVAHYLKAVELDAVDVEAHLQLAKLYEHRVKDYDKALQHAEAATALEGEESVERRKKRILKKKEKHDKRKW